MLNLPDRIRRASPRRRALIALMAGAVSALAMPPFGLWPVLALTLPTLVFLIDATAPTKRTRLTCLRSAFGVGWAFGMGYFLAGLWWIGQAFLVQADAFAWLMPFAVLLLPAGLALFTALGCMLARALWWPGPARLLVLAVALTFSEWLRGTVLTGFPWNNFGYALADDLHFAQGAAVFGLFGLCFIALATLATPAALFDARLSRRARFLPPMLAVLTLAGLWGAGAWRLATTQVGTVPGVKLRIMQPNLPQDQKFRYDARRTVMDLYIATSESESGLNGITHLIWPESAFPFFLEREPEAIARIAAMLPDATILITGAARLDPVPGQPRPKAYNSLRAIGSDGAILANADKVHLVPFGEYLPFQETLESLGFEQLTRQRGGFSAAPNRALMRIPGLPPAVPLICYEAIFPGQIMPPAGASIERPGFLLNVSNDAWFGMTPGPYQHFEQARLRTIEEGLPMIRATNNGVSAIIDPVGRTIATLPLGVRGVLDGALPLTLSNTIYASYGILMPCILVLMGLLVAFMLHRRGTRLD
ncbi:MAG TPA: apolipoprotein N-acyltransferase [Ancylobacter sp.]